MFLLMLFSFSSMKGIERLTKILEETPTYNVLQDTAGNFYLTRELDTLFILKDTLFGQSVGKPYTMLSWVVQTYWATALDREGNVIVPEKGFDFKKVFVRPDGILWYAYYKKIGVEPVGVIKMYDKWFNPLKQTEFKPKKYVILTDPERIVHENSYRPVFGWKDIAYDDDGNTWVIDYFYICQFSKDWKVVKKIKLGVGEMKPRLIAWATDRLLVITGEIGDSIKGYVHITKNGDVIKKGKLDVGKYAMRVYKRKKNIGLMNRGVLESMLFKLPSGNIFYVYTYERPRRIKVGKGPISYVRWMSSDYFVIKFNKYGEPVKPVDGVKEGEIKSIFEYPDTSNIKIVNLHDIQGNRLVTFDEEGNIYMWEYKGKHMESSYKVEIYTKDFGKWRKERLREYKEKEGGK